MRQKCLYKFKTKNIRKLKKGKKKITENYNIKIIKKKIKKKEKNTHNPPQTTTSLSMSSL
jgi:hypothetical protein